MSPPEGQNMFDVLGLEAREARLRGFVKRRDRQDLGQEEEQRDLWT